MTKYGSTKKGEKKEKINKIGKGKYIRGKRRGNKRSEKIE
jgi:hypothetical protein